MKRLATPAPLLAAVAAVAALAALAGCMAPPTAPTASPVPAAEAPAPVPAPVASAPGPRPGPGTLYHCHDGSTLAVDFGTEAIELHGLPEGSQRLLRDAGGVTPTQTVWSNPRVRAEFGLGPDAAGAEVHVLPPRPLDLQCRR